MITIQGKSKHEGVAVAVVARVDSISGINGVDHALLQQGINALRKGLVREDYPEVVIACDNVAMGISLKIPGMNTIGIAAESDMDVPGLDADVPCVIGLPGLLDSVEQGGIVIADGTKGVVYIDPDPQTLIHYQHIEEERTSRSKVFIATEHIPARTQSGETVNVYAHITNEGEVEQALDEGADGLLVDLRGSEADAKEFYRALMRAAPGKPIVFALDVSCAALMEAAAGYTAPGQVTVAFPPESFDELSAEVNTLMEADSNSAEVNIGCIAKDSESHLCDISVHRYIADMRKSPLLKSQDVEELTVKLAEWIDNRDSETTLLIIGKHVEAVERLVSGGARSLAVHPSKVGATKYAVRAIGVE